MVSKNFYWIFVLALVFTLGCDKKKAKIEEKEILVESTNTDTTTQKKSELQNLIPGKIQAVKASKDSLVNYSLYIPQKYSASKAYPIVYFFDPQGNGNLPVEKYQQLADRFEMILAGSYNSKNGLSWDKIQPQILVMMEDCKSKLSIDKNRVYTSGFSGGARIASGMAISGDEIKGVIGCGGGFPGKSNNIGYPFEYYGIVGEEDFNLGEMRQLDMSINNSGMTHYISEVKGGHQWPDAQEMHAAFLWLKMNAMRKNVFPKNQLLIDSLANAGMAEIKLKRKKNEHYEALVACKKWISFLKDLKSVETFKSEGNSLFQSESVKATLAQNSIIEEKEMELTRKLWSAFEKEDMQWWKSNYSNLLTLSQNSTLSREERSMYKRIKGFLGLAAFSFSNSAIQQADYEKALKFLQIYELVEPKNSEHAYLHAKIYAAKGNWKLAHSSLKKAVHLGFTDTLRVEEDKIFKDAPDKREYKLLLSRIK
jgi:predicted esterase